MKNKGVFMIFFILIFSLQPQGEMKMNLEVIGDIGANTKTELVKLENVKASEIEPFVSSRLTKFGSCQVNDPMNMLIITDYESKLKDIIAFVKKIDRMGTKEFLKLKTLSIPVNYILPSTILGALKSRLSPEGKIDANDELGIIIVTDVESKIQDVMQVVLMLDTPPRQVLLKGKIIEITKENALNLGINEFDIIKYINVYGEGSMYKTPSEEPSYTANVNFNIGLAISQIEQIEMKTGKNYSKEFSIIVMNNNPGKIPIGDDKYIVLTPHIGYKGYINFKIEIQQRIKETLNFYLEKTDYYKVFNEFETNVSLYNNDTLIISGVKTIGKEKVERGIPVIKNIPILGYLFKRETTIDMEKTLIILIYPEILPIGK